MKSRILLIVLCLMFAVTVSASAATVTVTWTQPTSCANGIAMGKTGCPAVTQNSIYVGNASGVYAAPVVIPAATTYTMSVSTSQTLYIAVTATNSAGESGKSNESVVAVVVNGVTGAPTGCQATQTQ